MAPPPAGEALDLSISGSQVTVTRRPSSASPGKSFCRSVSVIGETRRTRNALTDSFGGSRSIKNLRRSNSTTQVNHISSNSTAADATGQRSHLQFKKESLRRVKEPRALDQHCAEVSGLKLWKDRDILIVNHMLMLMLMRQLQALTFDLGAPPLHTLSLQLLSPLPSLESQTFSIGIHFDSSLGQTCSCCSTHLLSSSSSHTLSPSSVSVNLHQTFYPDRLFSLHRSFM
ncbi:hypothetical protein WMY93_033944 [Mugilogobius chulae]|uniref:Uncharacterized protein n=1 Tax=Mugilogobius chulae TaxID=88201 RepID=A0AAW0MFX1_9GOBI